MTVRRREFRDRTDRASVSRQVEQERQSLERVVLRSFVGVITVADLRDLARAARPHRDDPRGGGRFSLGTDYGFFSAVV
jgi:hypothetical protein